MPEERHVIAERLLKQHLGDQAARAEALNMANGPGIDGVPIYGDIIGSQRPALPRNEAPGGMMPVQQPGAMQIRGYLDENEEMTPMGEEFLALVDAGMFDNRGNLTAEGKAFGMTREDARDEEDNLESYMIRQKAGLDEDPDGGSLADVTWNLGRDFLRGGAILFRRAALGKYANTFTEREKADGSSMTLEERDAYDEIALQETGKQSLTGNATIGSGAASVLVAQPLAKLEGNEFKFYAAKQAHDRQVAEFNDASAGELWGGLTGSLEAINSLEKQAAAAEALIGPEQAEKARLEGGAASIITDPSTILTMGVGGFVGKGGVALSMTAKAEKAALARLAALEATSARAAAETVAKRSAELSRQAAARADNLQALGKDATMARGYSERMATRSAEAWDDVTRLDGVIAVRAGDVAKLTKDARVAEALLGIGERARAMRAVPFKAFGELAERMGAGIIKLDDGLREAATKYGFESVGKLLSNPLTPVAIGAVTAGPVGAVVAGAGRALASGPVLKSIGNFSRVVGAELMQRRGMIPFFQRVANNSTLTPIARATAHLLDTATLGGKAGIPLRMAGQAAKGTAAAAPIDMAFEWVEAGGDLGPAEMKQALAESIIFGGGAGVVAGSRNALQQQQLGDEINFRNGLVDREVLAFGRMNPGARRVLSSYAAANPALRFNLTTEGNSYMDRTSNTMTLNTRQSDWMAPIIGHEVSHFIQIKGQMEAGITAMLVGDGATGGILRAPDGALNPDFKRFADAYNGRLVAQGINPLPIGDIAIEYFTESTVDDITTMVESGELARMAGRSNAERMVREMSRNLIGRVPFIRDLSMKFGTGMDRGGRMVMGTGILADGVRTIPGARAMLRGLMREQAGRRGDGVISEESATIPVQIMRDDPAMRSAMFSTLETDAAGNPIVDANGNVSITSRETELRRMAAGLIITELEAERIQNGRQLPEGELAPQTDGSWQGTHLSPESLQRLADSGVFNAKQLAMLGMLNRSAKGLTGETFLMIYQAATIPRKGKRKGYGTLPATFREVVPVGVKITKDGNIIVETMSVTQLVENVRERAASKRGKRLYNGSQVEILRDAQAVLDLHRKGERTDTYFADKYGSINGPEYKNFVNTAFGLMTRSQQDVNPIFAADSIRAGGVFKSRRLDRINQTTRMQGKPLFRFGYEQVKANLAPNGIPDPNIRMLPQEVPGDEQEVPAVDPAAAPPDKGVFARSLDQIVAAIPDRFVGEKEPGKPVVAPDGRPFLAHDLEKPIGDLQVDQAAVDQAWQDAVRKSGPAAARAIEELAKKGYVMTPPNADHWRDSSKLPLKDRFWYETSTEAMTTSFPGYAKRNDSGRVMDTIAATSPLADPNYNAKLATSILSEEQRSEPSVTPAVVQTGVQDALLGNFGRDEQRKIGSFGNTFRFLAGINDVAPLSTNDRQVAASFGIPDSSFGSYPVLYEAVARFYNEIRDHINSFPETQSMGPFQSWQLQAMSWVQTRADSRTERRENISVEDAYDGDAYAVAFKRTAAALRAGGIDVGTDPTTGLPLFTDEVLADPRVPDILVGPTKTFREDTIQTMEIVTKLRAAGERFLSIVDEAKRLGVAHGDKVATSIINRHTNRLLQRKSAPAKRADGTVIPNEFVKEPSALSSLAAAFGSPTADITRVEQGYGTFKGDFSQNLRVPLSEVPEKYRPAFLAILGKHYAQEAQAASRFVSTEPGGTPGSYSVFFHGTGDMESLGALASELSAAGHEANVSIRPNGILVDIHPQFGDAGPIPIDKTVLKNLVSNLSYDQSKVRVIDRDYSSIYLDRSEYAGTISAARKELLNDSAAEIRAIAGTSRKVSQDFVGGDSLTLPGVAKHVSRRAAKIRDSYRQRVSRLESAEASLKRLQVDFSKDMVVATKVIQGKIDAARLRDEKKAAKEQAEIAKAARMEERAAAKAAKAAAPPRVAKANVDPSTAKAIGEAMR